MNKIILIIILILLVLGVVFGYYFLKEEKLQDDSERGFLEGKITIGPLCPNFKESDLDSECQPTEETYENWQISVWTSAKETKIIQIKPDLDGIYKIELLEGEYVVDFEEQQPFGLGNENLPATIIINTEETIKLDINIDTGIR